MLTRTFSKHPQVFTLRLEINPKVSTFKTEAKFPPKCVYASTELQCFTAPKTVLWNVGLSLNIAAFFDVRRKFTDSNKLFNYIFAHKGCYAV